MKRRVVVTGIGAVTSLSCKVDDLWQRILRGESGIHTLKLFDTTDHKVKFAGDIYDWTIGKGVSIVSAQDVYEKGVDATARAILEKVGDGKTYLSFDIDCLDPAFAHPADNVRRDVPQSAAGGVEADHRRSLPHQASAP